MQWITTTQVLDDLKGSNDALAWNSFRDHFYPVIVRFAGKLGLSGALAEDAAQETMLAFLKAIRRGSYNREKGRLSHWIFGIARLVILDFRRRLPREKLVQDQTGATSYWDQVIDENAVQHTWELEWQKMILEKCLKEASRQFAPKVFRAFELYALEEMPVEEVCKTLDMSRNAVYIAKNRVLSKMRNLQHDLDT